MLPSTKGAGMPSEHHEHHETQHALQRVFEYISPGTNEGISFSLSRVTDDLFADSFLAGGDISLFTASGHRGTITSQLSYGYVLASGGGAAAEFPVDLSVDLGSGRAEGSWTLPDGTAQAPHFDLQHTKTLDTPDGVRVLFSGETTSDDAVYSLALVLI
jgi:hypothetical protein